VSENSLTYEERIAAEVETRLQEEMSRKLGSIATAEVIRSDDDPSTNTDGPQQQSPQSTNNNQPSTMPLQPPTPQHVEIDSPSESAGAPSTGDFETRKKRKRWCLWIGIVFLVVIAAVGGTIAGVILERTRDKETDDVPTMSPSSASTGGPPIMPAVPTTPTTSPGTLSPATPERYNTMRQSLLQVSDSDTLDDESSPQHSAFLWLTYEDGLQLEPTPSFELYQRYVVAVFYFAMDGRRWKQQCRFLSATNVCDWNNVLLQMGVFCQNGSLNVQKIQFDSNGLRGGPIPSEIQHLEALERLFLYNNDILGPVPAAITRLTNLTYFDLDRNLFSSTLPSELSTMTNLQYFYATSNRLTGPIPDLTLLSNLIHIFLDDNRLTRLPEFPAEDVEGGNTPQMQSVSFSLNRLAGTIGESICNLQELTEFSVYSNELSGEIPSCMGDLANLGKFLPVYREDTFCLVYY
jgi:hypothetical protein